MAKKLTCIVCPMGCSIAIDDHKVEGAACKRGEKWAIQEFTNPVRTLTTTVAIEGARVPLLPVRTKEAVPKGALFKCMEHVSKLKIKAPVKVGDEICQDLGGTGISLIATKSMENISTKGCCV